MESQSSIDRLSRIENQLDRILNTINILDKITAKLDAIIEVMVLDVDRLKEHKKSSEQTAYIVWATAIGLFLKTIWDFLTKK
jgi:hypothetical protein